MLSYNMYLSSDRSTRRQCLFIADDFCTRLCLMKDVCCYFIYSYSLRRLMTEVSLDIQASGIYVLNQRMETRLSKLS